jgi:hypothetical protein
MQGLKPKKSIIATSENIKAGDRLMLIEQSKDWPDGVKRDLLPGITGIVKYRFSVQWDNFRWESFITEEFIACKI